MANYQSKSLKTSSTTFRNNKAQAANVAKPLIVQKKNKIAELKQYKGKLDLDLDLSVLRNRNDVQSLY
ncbi:hypothetical protein H206_03861 [Candidatus Electrothrix aarhusensis]|uniref:Uncharacterized protein n=1 Tax=Candidatus Electrothrix aarhusensis TaxID=1859131 RepID=A0A3S3UCT2_9BACT|nr:hypothetical protein H206_03861 [Candidatus Electrothrix aarhusensis]